MEKLKHIKPDAEAIISIGEKIIDRHMHLGPESPLSNILIADLNSRISQAKQKHEEGTKYKKLMEDALRDRDHHLGNEEKGVMLTLESIYNKLKEENINANNWGF